MQIRAQFKARPRPNHCSPRPLPRGNWGPWVRAHTGSRTRAVATALCCRPLGLLSHDLGLHCPAVTRVGECLRHGFCGEDGRAPGGGHCSRAAPQTASEWLCPPVRAGRPSQVKKPETAQKPSSPPRGFRNLTKTVCRLRSALPLCQHWARHGGESGEAAQRRPQPQVRPGVLAVSGPGWCRSARRSGLSMSLAGHSPAHVPAWLACK